MTLRAEGTETVFARGRPGHAEWPAEAAGWRSSAYSYANNKLTSTSTQSCFTYDGYGNVTYDSRHTFQDDDASNLTCVDCGAGNQVSYVYDGNNRRVSRTQGGSTTYYVHIANGDLILEYTPSTQKGMQQIYVNGKRVASKAVMQ